MVLGVFLGVDQARRGHGEGWLYVGSFLPMGAGAGVTLLQIVGLAPPHSWLGGLWQPGSAFQMLILAMGLANELNRLKQQKLDAEREAKNIQAGLAADLEAQVRERTSELQAVNLQLARRSITDPLTNAFNRRHFDQRCSDLLQARRRTPAPVALCMLDIDHFKGFNDRYGHQAGDQTLVAVASSIREKLRRTGDELFRLGGEEFGVLFTSTSAALAVEFVEELRLAVRALAITHSGSEVGIVTASFGLGYWGAGALGGITPKSIYSHVDSSLYAAKADGRDRVVMTIDHCLATI
jgi:diguanylate cyclase